MSSRKRRWPSQATPSNSKAARLSTSDLTHNERCNAHVEEWNQDTDEGLVLTSKRHQIVLHRSEIAATFGTSLMPKPGDLVRLTVPGGPLWRPSVHGSDCRPLSLAERSLDEWLAFVDRLHCRVDRQDASLLAELGDTTVWRALFVGAAFDLRLSSAVCRLLTSLARLRKFRDHRIGRGLDNVLTLVTDSQTVLGRLLGPLLADDRDRACGDSPLAAAVNSRQLLVDFVRSLLKCDSGILTRLVPLLRGASGISSELLVDLLAAVAEQRPTARQSASIVPSREELAAGRSSMLTGLEKARITEPYKSVEEYFDTMFGLLRADCFEKFYICMDQIKKGELDGSLDMRVYYNVKVQSVKLTTRNTTFSIGVTFDLNQSDRAPSNWNNVARLMPGNLLCLASDKQFSEQFWLTVADREIKELKSQRLIWLELCNYMCRELPPGDVLVKLLLSSTCASNGMIMLESPTLFRAFEPVLERLKCYDTENFPFADTLVFGDMSAAKPRPAYVNDYYNEQSDDAVIEPPKDLPFISLGNLTLDECQATAFANALHSRIYVCQGPPGTGKTLLGVLIARQLLTLDVLIGRPLLILCYKNHALDEFLTHLLPEHEENIVRIGGRCKEPRLDSVGLFEQRKKFPVRGRWKRIKSIVSELEEAWELLKQSLKRLDWLFEHPAAAILNACDENQLNSIVHFNSHNRKKRHPDLKEASEAEIRLMHAPASELYDVINFDGLTFKAFSDFVDQSMPNISEQLQSYRPEKPLTIEPQKSGNPTEKAQTSSYNYLQTHCKTKTGNVNSQTKPDRENTHTHHHQARLDKGAKEPKSFQKKFPSAKQEPDQVSDIQYDVADEEEVREREDQLLASLPRRDETKRSKPESKFAFESITKSRIILDRGLEQCCNSGLMQHLSKQDPTKLSRTEQWLFFQQALYKLSNETKEEITQHLKTILQLENEKRLIDIEADAEILRRKRIIGMTITGASINKDLLELVKPAVVIVEEAAEVGEPQLLACIGPKTEHLILIGDHMQLRPQTESFILAKDYNLDISMMERLIKSGISYDQLELQSRMRPEFSILLRDIYPKLRDNLAVVSREFTPPCFVKPMFFWTHSEKESSAAHGHGAINFEEAHRCVQLALFLISQGCDPARISILSAYKGQTSIIRRYFLESISKGAMFQHLRTDSERQLQIKIFTIDLYQGDENDVVIVSLVRSNLQNYIGFLKTLNRRCVAQSRAKLAMVFVGNADCLYNSSAGKNWRPLVNKMKELDYLGPSIPLRCSKHAGSVIHADNFHTVPVNIPFCYEPCGSQKACSVHSCTLPLAPSAW